MKRILIVDDNKAVRNALTYLLSDFAPDAEVTHAVNGVDAYDKAESGDFDLILMDISMPLMDGISATELICKKLPGQKIVGVSMHSDKEEISKMRHAGAVGYIMKDQAAERMEEMLATMAKGQEYFPEY